MKICPICGKEYTEHPAISRKDNKTEICPDCGTLEALDAFGATEEMKEEILQRIHKEKEGIKL